MKSEGAFLCMLGVALASLAGRVPPTGRRAGPSEAAHRPTARFDAPAAPSARLAGAFLADIDGRRLPSPHPPVGSAVTLLVPGTPHPVRAVRLELEDEHAPYYLDTDGRMLETQWRWEAGTLGSTVRYRRGVLEVPSPT